MPSKKTARKKRTHAPPAIKRWGLNKPPFQDYTLDESHEHLFVNRTTELMKAENATAGRLAGIYGKQGVGKSSLLRMLSRRIKDIPVVYARVGMHQKTVWRELLIEVLLAIKAKTLKLTRSSGIDVTQELRRAKYGIDDAWEAEGGVEGSYLDVKLMPYLKIKRGSKSAPHTEEQALTTLLDVLGKATTHVVLLIDDMERVRIRMEVADYVSFTYVFARTISESLSDEGTSVAITVDESFFEQAKASGAKTKAAVGFDFDPPIQITGLLPIDVALMVSKRLADAGWKKKLGDFVDLAAFWVLILGVAGRPREVLRVLNYAMTEAASKPLALYPINLASMVTALQQHGIRVDEQDTTTVEYLIQHGAASPGDSKLQRALGVKRTQVLRRLQGLQPQLKLSVTKQKTGKTTKDLYSLPDIDFDQF